MYNWHHCIDLTWETIFHNNFILYDFISINNIFIPETFTV